MKLLGKTLLVSTLAFCLATAAHAAPDPACNPLIKASEARAAAPASQAITVVSPSNFTMKFIKVGGKSYSQTQGSPWKLSPVDISEAERQLITQINSGAVKISKCKLGSDETINGMVTTVLNYTIEMPGAPAAAAKLYIGKSDGLPYLQISAETKTTYSYKEIKAPKM